MVRASVLFFRLGRSVCVVRTSVLFFSTEQVRVLHVAWFPGPAMLRVPRYFSQGARGPC